MLRAKSFLEVIFIWMLKHRITTIIIFLFIVSGSVYLSVWEMQQTNNTEKYSVVRKNLEEAVSLTGTVKPAQDAELSFQNSGVVKNIYVSVGERVKQGDVLANLTNDDDKARILEAQANLKSEQATLSDLKTGARSETVSIKKSSLEKTDTDIAQAYKNADDSIKNLSNASNNFIKNNLASYFTGDIVTGYRINVTSCDSMKETQVNILRSDAELALKKIDDSITNFNTTNDSAEQDTILKDVKEVEMPRISNYLNSTKDLFSSNCMTANPNYDSARSIINNSLVSFISLGNDLSTKINIIENLKIAKSQAQDDLKIADSPEKSDKLNQQSARVAAAQARLLEAEAQNDKNILKAPFSGVITNIDLKKGELVSPGGKTISIISDSAYQIESKVSEIDVAKLAVGATSTVTFDAYGENITFTAVISNISPAGIISEGVPTYKTIFDFVDKDERIRSGMTANISVITHVHPNVIAIPAKYIMSMNGKKFVDVVDPKDAGDVNQVEVKTDSLGRNGDIEILDGLNEGDVVQVKKVN